MISEPYQTLKYSKDGQNFYFNEYLVHVTALIENASCVKYHNNCTVNAYLLILTGLNDLCIVLTVKYINAQKFISKFHFLNFAHHCDNQVQLANL